MFDLIFFIVFVVLFSASVVSNIYLKVQNMNIQKRLAQTIADKIIILDRLEKELDAKNNKSIEQTDGFIRFVSQSRDWAFEYIENAQDRIKKFNDELNNIINLGGNKKETVKLILEAYKPIKDLLPEEQGEK